MKKYSAPSDALLRAFLFVLVLFCSGLVLASEIPDFEKIARSHEKQTTADRRWLHENPELSNRETGTQAYLRRALEEIPGITFIEGDWGTGLVADPIEGNQTSTSCS